MSDERQRKIESIAQKIEEAQATARMLNQGDYEAKVALYKTPICTLSNKWNVDYLETAVRVLKDAKASGSLSQSLMMWTLAATGDLINEEVKKGT